DDGNNISDSYQILRNLRDNSYAYVAGSASITYNTAQNQLVKLDPVTNNYGLLNTNTYTFLQLKDYPAGFPLRHDQIKIHLPINYTFGEYLGCYVRIYGFDFNNQFTFDLSNFYFDGTNVDQSYLLNYNSPPLLFQEKLWGKNLTINVPSLYAVANQRVNNLTKENTLNFNLTNGLGMSLNSPIFIDFHFITQKKTVNNITTYYLTAKTPITIPQAPDFENLGVQIQHSSTGDYFEIFGVYNGDINQFDNFINSAVQLGNRYYVTYTVTLYEQNIRGKSFTITVTDNFNERVEYRPIIKYSTTTAIIDVEMNVIDAVDNSSIYRRASYGMLQDEVGKYSLNLMKINIANASKPKIYNIKSPEGAGIFGNGGRNGSGPQNPLLAPGANNGNYQVALQTVKVNYAVLADRFNVVAKSENVRVGNRNFYGIGKLQLLLQPFDNIVQIIVARDVSSDVAINQNTATQELITAPDYLDMSNMGEIKFVIKNTELAVEATLYLASNQVDLANGITVFKIPASKINDIRKIYNSGINVFYITSTTDSGTTVIYSGLFVIYDSRDNVQTLNNNLTQLQSGFTNTESLTILQDPSSQNTAVVTRRILQTTRPTSGTASSTSVAATSLPSSTIVEKISYTIDAQSNLIVDGYSWSPSQIKSSLNLDKNPNNLTFKTDTLFTNNQTLGRLPDVKLALEKLLVTQEQRDQYN
ncbi:hypothetical protein EBU71_15420, partial [bacterium]|nr:hypothetical protein [Candidatus Elulimicrobium humile]